MCDADSAEVNVGAAGNFDSSPRGDPRQMLSENFLLGAEPFDDAQRVRMFSSNFHHRWHYLRPSWRGMRPTQSVTVARVYAGEPRLRGPVRILAVTRCSSTPVGSGRSARLTKTYHEGILGSRPTVNSHLFSRRRATSNSTHLTRWRIFKISILSGLRMTHT